MQPMTGTPVTFVNVTNRERALEFYCGTLGLSIRSTDAFGDFLDFGSGSVAHDRDARPQAKPAPGARLECR